jgi:TatD DNase family protein
MFVDSHAHLEMEQFDPDREQVFERARAEGLDAIVAIGSGTGPGSLDCGIRLAETARERLASDDGSAQSWPRVYATIGIHPHEAKLAVETDYLEMEKLARSEHVIAWGEIGLDYFYDHSPREVQQDVFIRQMELARSARLPVVIHCRPSENSQNAWDDCLSLLREHWAGSGMGGVLHCFSGSLEHARAALEMGFVISFAGNITFPKAQTIREVAREVPLDRMFIETDSPFLAPVPYRGKRNEPAFVKEVARQIGELRGLSREDAGAQTATNFRRFFSLPENQAAI